MLSIASTTSTTQTENSRNSQAATNALARLLATENIRVEHQPVNTAMFDTVSRTLVLPIWVGMSQDLYDMLVGHEVGHALWTPSCAKEVTDAIARIRKLGAPSDAWAKSLLNIVEDARIERKIKEKFPGIRKNFVIAYRELIARDIFGLAETNGDPNGKGFPDRFNLYHKCGALGLMQIAFTTEELTLVKRGQTTESFNDVVCLCEDIFKFMRNQMTNQPDNQNVDDNDEQSEQQAQQDDTANGDGDQMCSSTDTSSDIADEECDDSSDQSNQSTTSESDKSKSDEYNSSSKGSQTDSDLDPGRGRSGADGDALDGISTDRSMIDGLGKMADVQNNRYYNRYAEVPQFQMDRLLISAEDVIALWRKSFEKSPNSTVVLDSLHKSWLRDNMPTIMNMVKRFEQRKAADDAKRTMSAKTGRIDTSRLAYYKVSEDLFLSTTTTTDGKNHGLFMVVDWSGSMSDVLGSVLSQVLCLVEFCRKTGVPYEVYAFSDCVSGWKPNEDITFDSLSKKYEVTHQVPGTLAPAGFRMVQFLRDGMSRADHHDAVRGLIAVMAINGYKPFTDILRPEAHKINPQVGGYYQSEYLYTLAPGFRPPDALTLKGTPLNEALLACADLTEAFRKRTNAQIVNLAVLTDGEASRNIGVHAASSDDQHNYTKDSQGRDRREAIVLRWGSRQYSFTNTRATWTTDQFTTNVIIRYLRDRTGARVYGFFLTPLCRAKNFVKMYSSSLQMQESAVAQMNHEGSCCMPHEAFDEYYVVGVDGRTESEDFMDRLDTPTMSARKIAASFAKGMIARSTSRTIMVRFADCFATGKPSQRTVR